MFILDNTVLSNFFTIQNIDLLSKILENNVIVPSFVRDEFYMTKGILGLPFLFLSKRSKVVILNFSKDLFMPVHIEDSTMERFPVFIWPQ